MRLGKILAVVGTTAGNIIQFDYDAGQEFEIVRRKGLKIFSLQSVEVGLSITKSTNDLARFKTKKEFRQCRLFL